MPISAEELIDKSIDQRARGRYDEALVSALAAVELDEENPSGWWQLALSRNALKDWQNAATAFEKVLEHNPLADNAWALLGSAREKLNETDHAETAYREALDWNETNYTALLGMANIYKNRDNALEHDDEISVLERIENSSADLTYSQKIRLALLHYNNARYHEAIKYWKTAGEQFPDASLTHNIGLAYHTQAISQDADAVDMWRLALDEDPEYQPSLNMIEQVMPRLIELANDVQSLSFSTLKENEYFDGYLNPFQIMNLTGDVFAESLTVKDIQKYKKMLLQEIDLEDGHVSWLDGANIDKSRAIKVCDELGDEVLKSYHLMVLKDEGLLSFLTKGDVGHFLVKSESSLPMLSMLDRDPKFREWIGQYFVRQYDRVLTRVLDGPHLQIIEGMLDGRRWVSAAQEHECFENSRRVIDRLIQPLRELAEASENTKPSYMQIERLVEGSLLLPKLNMLPLYFEVLQNEAITSLRDTAINCVNQHDDSDLSVKIIGLCKKFKFKSRELRDRLDADANDIAEILAEEKKNEVFLTSGANKWQITKCGAESNGQLIKVEDVDGVRWGTTVTANESGRDYTFTVAVSGNGAKPIVFHWSAKSWSSDIEKQQGLFKDLIDAVFSYLMPSLLERTEAGLRDGEIIPVGPCILSESGIKINVKGWFSTTPYKISWNRCSVSVDNGEMTVREQGSSKNKVSFSFKDTFNAPLLLVLSGRRKSN